MRAIFNRIRNLTQRLLIIRSLLKIDFLFMCNLFGTLFFFCHPRHLYIYISHAKNSRYKCNWKRDVIFILKPSEKSVRTLFLCFVVIMKVIFFFLYLVFVIIFGRLFSKQKQKSSASRRRKERDMWRSEYGSNKFHKK